MSSVFPSRATSQRIEWVDAAKAIGIFLVFYGHFVQRFVDLGVSSALYQMRWVYAFHIPLFFLLVGLVYKDRGLSLDVFIKRQVLTRLVPVWVFNIVNMLLSVASEYLRGESGWVVQHGWASLAGHFAKKTWAMFYQGQANWNIVTWFLICLFTVEFWQFFLQPLLRKTWNLVFSIGLFGVATVLVSTYAEDIHNVLGPKQHWWHVSSGLGAMFFYQLGILMRRLGLLIKERSTLHRCALGAICLAVTLATFNLNDPLNNSPLPVVLMVGAKYGNVWWFFLTALAGTGFVIYASQLLAVSSLLKYVGQVTLALMCLDGIFHDFVNPPVARLIVSLMPEQNVLLFTGIYLVGTALSIVISIPVIWLLNRYLPFVLGRGMGRAAVTSRAQKDGGGAS